MKATSKMFKVSMSNIRRAKTLREIRGIKESILWMSGQDQYDSEQELVDLLSALHAKEKEMIEMLLMLIQLET